ncbi:hypothetical protein IMG5_021440, partial [Ichthyophthirius multifiliis]
TILILSQTLIADQHADCQISCYKAYDQDFLKCSKYDQECLHAASSKQIGCLEICSNAKNQGRELTPYEKCQSQCQQVLVNCANKCNSIGCLKQCNQPYRNCELACQKVEKIRKYDKSCSGNCQYKHDQCSSLCKPQDKVCLGKCNTEMMGCGESCRHVLKLSPEPTQFEQCQQKCQLIEGDCVNKCTDNDCVQKCNEPFIQCVGVCQKQEKMREYDIQCLGNCQYQYNQCISKCNPKDKKCQGKCNIEMMGCGESCRHVQIQYTESTKFEQCQQQCQVSQLQCFNNCTNQDCVNKCYYPSTQCVEKCNKQEYMDQYDPTCQSGCNSKLKQCTLKCTDNDCVNTCYVQYRFCGKQCRYTITKSNNSQSWDEKCQQDCQNAYNKCISQCEDDECLRTCGGMKRGCGEMCRHVILNESRKEQKSTVKYMIKCQLYKYICDIKCYIKNEDCYKSCSDQQEQCQSEDIQ